MTHDLESLEHWLRVCLIVAAICTTAFPILWAFSSWYSTQLGRVLMLQAVAFALAIDLTLFFQYYTPTNENIMFVFWTNAIVFTLIAVATLWLTYVMCKMNYLQRRQKRESQNA